MDTTLAISAWRALIQPFFPMFPAPAAQIFLALVTGWVLYADRHTLTDILPFADLVGQHAHDAFHRFLPDARWNRDTLWKLPTLPLVKTFATSGVIELDLDDTLFRRCGREVAGARWRRDAVRATRTRTVFAWGVESGGSDPSRDSAVRWYHVSKTPVLLVICRDPAGQEQDDFFFRTDLTRKPAQAVGGLAGRWSIERHEAVHGKPRASDLEGPRPRASGDAESVLAFSDVVVVSGAEEPLEHRLAPTLASEEGPRQLSGRVGESSVSPVRSANKIGIRRTTRTWQEYRSPSRSPRKGSIDCREECESSLSQIAPTVALTCGDSGGPPRAIEEDGRGRLLARSHPLGIVPLTVLGFPCKDVVNYRRNRDEETLQ
jgi:hypothetical protein